MPYKPKVSQSALAELSRARDSRHERQRRIRRITLIGIAVVTVLTVLLVGAFLVEQFIVIPNRAAAQVGGETITLTDLQRRMKLELAQATSNYNQLAGQVDQLQQQASADPEGTNSFLVQFYQQQLQQVAAGVEVSRIAQAALDNLIKDRLIRQGAARRGISVVPDALKQEIERSVGFYRATLTPFPTYTPAPPPTPTPVPLTPTAALTASAPSTVTVTPEPTLGPPEQPTSVSLAELDQIKTRAREFYTSLTYGDTELEREYESSLYATRLQEAFAGEVPTETQHYVFDFVRFNTPDAAQSGSDRLAGRQITFEALISETNTITQPASLGNGGTRDWTSKNTVEQQFGNEVLAALEATPLGQASSIITSSLGGYYIVLPTAREVRPFGPSELSSVQRQAYDDWLAGAAADAARVQRLIDPLEAMPATVRQAIEEFQRAVAQTATTP